ncbi:L-lactate dehydrogenase [Kineobactrum salinum]|uniref:L-lactate dehydrogenase n=1 Tax=Kineobactrum salinum TaxID=2708301 RepID=UPI001E39A182|nr:L-lactate dehydrogenase [Kineobactrum salinum]
MSVYDVVPVTVADYRRLAMRRLPRFLFDYIDGGANDEITLAANTSAFRALRLKQRVMRDVSSVDTSTLLFGRQASMPLALAPVGMAGMFARRGEVQAARAAQRVGVPFTSSTVGICPLEEIRVATSQPFWFQLYMLRDRDFIGELLERAERAGCETLAFTIDLPLPGLRLRDFRNGMLGGGWPGKLSRLAQLAISPGWAWDVGIRGRPHSFGNLADKVANPEDLDAYKAFVDSQFDPRCTWKDIHWLREQWRGKLLIKGLMEADDARAAVDAGADGVVVSNHGARQLDAVAPSISKLRSVSEAVGADVEVYLDGGVRSGIDIAKALAFGARGVLVGRPWVFAMAARGEQGLVELLDLFQRELATAMALMGVNRVSDLNAAVMDQGCAYVPSRSGKHEGAWQ